MMKRAEDKIDEAQKQIDVLSTFRKNLRKYCKAYTYISQIVDLDDPELEIFYGFCSLLSHRINGDDGTDVDINSLVMSDYRINKVDVPDNPDDHHTLKPMTAGHMTSGSKQEELDDIIRQINLIWGEDTPAEEGAEILNAIADKVSADEVSRTQIRNSSNSKDAIIQDGRLARIVTMAAMQLKGEEFTAMVNKILNDPQSFNALLPIIYDLVNNKTRFDVEAVQKAGRDSRKKK
jgi:type I restriction enzyme R subunit